MFCEREAAVERGGRAEVLASVRQSLNIKKKKNEEGCKRKGEQRKRQTF